MNGRWNVEYTDEFETWWSGLTDAAQDDIDRVVLLLEKIIAALGGKFSFHVEFDNFNCELQMPRQMAMA